MTAEQRFFLNTIGDHLNRRESRAGESPDWGIVRDYAQKHQVAAMVYDQCRALIPEDAAEPFRSAYAKQLSDHVNRKNVLKKIDACFTAHHIPYLLFKGMEVAEFYPKPALRSMGDCDILVRAEDKERAGDLLLELGFSGDDRQDMEWRFFVQGMEFELHHRLL